MSAVDVSGLKAGQLVRATYEGVLVHGPDEWLGLGGLGGPMLRNDVLGGGATSLVAVKVLAEPEPEWVSQQGEVVRWGDSVMMRAEHKWISTSQGSSPDDFVWAAVQSGAAVHLVPEPTP